jgi:hypothetical protein
VHRTARPEGRIPITIDPAAERDRSADLLSARAGDCGRHVCLVPEHDACVHGHASCRQRSDEYEQTEQEGSRSVELPGRGRLSFRKRPSSREKNTAAIDGRWQPERDRENQADDRRAANGQDHEVIGLGPFMSRSQVVQVVLVCTGSASKHCASCDSQSDVDPGASRRSRGGLDGSLGSAWHGPELICDGFEGTGLFVGRIQAAAPAAGAAQSCATATMNRRRNGNRVLPSASAGYAERRRAA